MGGAVRRLGMAVGAMAALLWPAAGLAQTASEGTIPPAATAPEQVPVLILDQERLFQETRYGKAILARLDGETQALEAENRKIEAALEAEERDLTAKRPTMAPEVFRPLADAFDKKVRELRAAQDAKSRDLVKKRDEERQNFFKAVAPVLAKVMRERGAVAILDRGAVVMSFTTIDMTDAAIARVDTEMGDGPAPAAP